MTIDERNRVNILTPQHTDKFIIYMNDQPSFASWLGDQTVPEYDKKKKDIWWDDFEIGKYRLQWIKENNIPSVPKDKFLRRLKELVDKREVVSGLVFWGFSVEDWQSFFANFRYPPRISFSYCNFQNFHVLLECVDNIEVKYSLITNLFISLDSPIEQDKNNYFYKAPDGAHRGIDEVKFKKCVIAQTTLGSKLNLDINLNPYYEHGQTETPIIPHKIIFDDIYYNFFEMQNCYFKEAVELCLKYRNTKSGMNSNQHLFQQPSEDSTAQHIYEVQAESCKFLHSLRITDSQIDKLFLLQCIFDAHSGREVFRWRGEKLSDLVLINTNPKSIVMMKVKMKNLGFDNTDDLLNLSITELTVTDTFNLSRITVSENSTWSVDNSQINFLDLKHASFNRPISFIGTRFDEYPDMRFIAMGKDINLRLGLIDCKQYKHQIKKFFAKPNEGCKKQIDYMDELLDRIRFIREYSRKHGDYETEMKYLSAFFNVSLLKNDYLILNMFSNPTKAVKALSESIFIYLYKYLSYYGSIYPPLLWLIFLTLTIGCFFGFENVSHAYFAPLKILFDGSNIQSYNFEIIGNYIYVVRGLFYLLSFLFFLGLRNKFRIH